MQAKLFEAAGEEALKVLTSLLNKYQDTVAHRLGGKIGVYTHTREGDGRECANYQTIVLNLQVSNVLFKVFLGRIVMDGKRNAEGICSFQKR